MFDFVYLASKSPRRAQLLNQLGVSHQLLVSQTLQEAQADEALETVLANEAPREYVQRVTNLKLDAAVKRLERLQLSPGPILCADTTVALGSVLYGKPQDAHDAARMLSQLSAQTHHVLTAVAVQNGSQRMQALSVSEVSFAPLSAQEIAAYVASGESMGKAGAYAVQGGAAAFICHISGSYSAIMGLPLFETAQLLKSLCNKTS